MPNTKSAKKALRQNVRRRVRNIKRKESYKTAVKVFRRFVASKEVDKAKEYLPKVYKALDKAAKAKVIKPNKANRLKSRLTIGLGK